MRYQRFRLATDQKEWSALLAPDQFLMTDADGSIWLYAPTTASLPLEGGEEVDLKEYVDWGVQWSTHSPDFKDYALQVDLSKYTSLKESFPMLHLKAGPGFGDLSHPTTRLTLAMMAPHVKGREVIDIGCGSGILSLSALLLGAQCVWGLDIDPEALVHAQENARLNGLESQVQFLQTADFSHLPPSGAVIVMNMIRTQQQQAWAALPHLHNLSAALFTSGILVTERKRYLSECAKRGWTLNEERTEGDWMAFSWKGKGRR